VGRGRVAAGAREIPPPAVLQTLLGNNFVGQTIDDSCNRRLTSKHYGRSVTILELITIARSVLDVSECHVSDLFVQRDYATL